MQGTHVDLYSYFPLSLNGPKGEGDQGGEGSPVGLGRCPPKCDTNPLTLPEHPCYYPHRSNTTLTISRRNQKPRGKPTRPTRGLNVQAHPNGRLAACGSSKRRHLLIPKAQAHLPPQPRRWNVHRLCSAGPVQGRPCRFNAPHHRVRLPRPIARRFSR